MVIKRTARPKVSSVRLALIFFCCVCILLFSAIAIKVVQTMHRSIFDGQHQFILLLITSAHSGLLTSFKPSAHVVTVLPLQYQSNANVLQKMGIRVDGMLHSQESEKEIKRALIRSIFTINTQTTWYDILRLYWIANTGVVTYTPLLHVDTLSQNDLSLISQALSDTDIVSENKTIQIMNASGISGVGKKIEQIATTIGGNVIDVRTANQIGNTSKIIYYGTISYTVMKLQRELQFPLQETDQKSIADIQIFIGRDVGDKF